jgi:hypothetical protein
MLTINQAQEVSGRFPASLIYVADREPIVGCPVNPMPLPCRSTAANIADPAEKKTRAAMKHFSLKHSDDFLPISESRRQLSLDASLTSREGQ